MYRCDVQMTPVICFARTLTIAFSIATSTVSPAPGAQLANGVSTICSHSHQGNLLYSECYSTIAYMDPRTSEVFYCNGDHQVLTRGAAVERFSVSAECVLTFRPFNLAGEYILLDVTKERLPKSAASEANLFPEAIAWIISNTTRELQYCSSFTAGLAGTQRRCVTAAFK
jgi:hypothetical protein